MKRTILFAAALFAAGPALAQTGVFNMGALTNTLSQDSVTQSERYRAQRRYSVRPRLRQPAPRMSLQEACYRLRTNPRAPYHPRYVSAMQTCRRIGL